MTEKFSFGDDFNAISAVMRAEVQNARRALGRIGGDPILGVHEARKAIKKVRSNARLIRKGDKTASRRIWRRRATPTAWSRSRVPPR